MRNNPFFQVLGLANFLKLWASQVFSQVTLNMINFVIVLKIFEATGSTMAISLVWIFYIIPVIFLGPFAGTIVDLLERRRILLFTNLGEAIIVLFYLLIKTKIWPIYGIVFLYSLVYQLYIPAEAASLPRVVPKKLLPAANSFFLFTIYGAILVGFSLAGPLVRIVGRETPFIIGSFFLLSAALAVRLLPRATLVMKTKIGKPLQFWERVKRGYLFIRHRPLLLIPLILLIFAQVIVAPLVLLAPSYATQVLNLDLLDVGPLLVLPFGLGALLGVQGVVWALKRMRKKRVVNFALFSASFWLFVLSIGVPFMPVGRLPVSALAIFFLGISYVSFIIPSQTLIQEQTPEEFRGRVFGFLWFAVNLALISPILFTGVIADILGATWMMFIAAFLVGLVWFYSLKEPYNYGLVVSKPKT